jgi:hypothetical protein
MSAPRQQGPIQLVAGIGGAIAGIAVGRYTGLNLLIPTGLAILVGWICSKLLTGPSKTFLVAFAIQAGHGLWMLLGAVLLKAYAPVALDLAIYVIGLAWLVYRPGIAPVVLLSLFQAIAIAVNLAQFLAAEIGTNNHKALLVHLIFRITAVVCMLAGAYQIRRHKQDEKTDFAGDVAGQWDQDLDPWRTSSHG